MSRVPAEESPYVRVRQTDDRIFIESDKIEATIAKRNPKHWMTGIEKGSFRDKTTGFAEVGDGLMVVDWLMEPGSDAAYAHQLIAPDGNGVVPYRWYENETDPDRRHYALMAHGSTHRKRIVEGPQLCHRMSPVEPEVIATEHFVAVRTRFRFQYAAPGRNAGSEWTQLVVFPAGKRYFFLMDHVRSANESPELFLRNDTPGCIRHKRGDTFTEIYLSYLGGPTGMRVPADEFFTPFPPDTKYYYRRDTHPLPSHFIRAYRIRDPLTGKTGPWLAGLTLEPSVVYESWCSQRPGDIVVLIQEIHGKPVKVGDTFSAAYVVGFFDSIEEMHQVYQQYRGAVAIEVNDSSWKLIGKK